MIERHLQRVDPSLDRDAAAPGGPGGVRLVRHYWLESFRLPNLSAATVERGFDVDGYENIVTGLAGGNGVILVLPHLGGWEWAGRWIADQGHQITVVVEKIEPPELFEWFVDLRSALGMNVVPLGAGAGTAVMRALHDNHVVCLLADRDLQGGGPEVEFFGERTTMPAGPATLALRTGAPILPDRRVLHRPRRRAPRVGAATVAGRTGRRNVCATTSSASRRTSPTTWRR